MSEFRPWLKKYPHGVAANINTEEYATVVDLLEKAFKKYAKNTAFTCMGKSMTYEQIDRYSRDFGAYLLSRGVEPGEKIAIMMPNLLQYPIALFGAMRAGLVVVNTNPLYTPREMEHQFKDSGATAIIIAENFAANLQKILPNTAIKTVITTSIGELLGFPKKVVVNFVVRNLKRMVPKFEILNTVSFTEALAQGKKFQIPPHVGKPDDVAVLQYTGGTTGVSKGAMLTNGNLVANMLQVAAWCKPFFKEGEEVALCPLPMYHIFAFTVNVLSIMSIGGQNVLVTNARDIPSVVKALQAHPITLITGVNTLFNALTNNPEFLKLDFSKLKVSAGGGMAVQKAVAEKWQKVTGCYLAEGYGMTESSPVATSNPYDGSGKIGSIGIPLPSTDLRIVDDQGNVVGPNQIGEIQIKGPQVMKGYYNNPEETSKTIVDGWLITGDIGLMHEDGYFQIVDRKKDMILVSGFNVFPNEVEDVIAAHPKVLEVAAIGVEDAKSGEAVKVFIVKKDKSLSKDEIIAYCKENLTAYKVPRMVEFRDELPKTNVGKILRRALKDA